MLRTFTEDSQCPADFGDDFAQTHLMLCLVAVFEQENHQTVLYSN